MAKIHEEFDVIIKSIGFKKDYDGYGYRFYDGTWHYKLSFEGYAYVLYKTINIYLKPLMYLFLIYNKFRKGTAEIGLHYQVPIAHFRDPQKLKQIMEILTDKLETNENN